MNHSLSLWTFPLALIALLACGITAWRRRRAGRMRRALRRAEKMLTETVSAIRRMCA